MHLNVVSRFPGNVRVKPQRAERNKMALEGKDTDKIKGGGASDPHYPLRFRHPSSLDAL